jgi:hypothetical protein
MRWNTANLLAFAAVALCSSASAQEVTFKEWEAEIDTLVEEAQGTRRGRDRLAFLREAGQLVQKRTDNSKKYLKKLDALLAFAPEGAMFDGLLNALIADGSVSALKSLLGTFERDDYLTLSERDLGDDQVEARRRIVEFRLLENADDCYLRVLEGKGESVADDVQAYLLEQLSNESERRVRGAALLLGGWSVEEAGEGLMKAFERFDDSSWTRAVLLEALGRTNPSLATTQVLASAGAKNTSERLAALPLLGFLEGEDAIKRLKKAFKDKRWYVRRAAIEACDIRRDEQTLGLLIEELPKAGPRLQKDIYKILVHATDGQLPATPGDIPDWWKAVKDGFQALPRGKERANKVEGAMATRVRQPRGYFSMTVATNQVAIVFDCSGSMKEGSVVVPADADGKGGASGNPFIIVKQQIVGLVKGFRGKARFNLIAYNDKVMPFKKSITKNSKGNLKAAEAYLGKLKAKGETNLYDALMLALSDRDVDTIFLLSDGAPNRGKRTAPRDILEGIQLANRFRKVVINTIQIGTHQEFMRLIAETNGGSYKHLKLR